jgi:hypothetical protein
MRLISLGEENRPENSRWFWMILRVLLPAEVQINTFSDDRQHFESLAEPPSFSLPQRNGQRISPKYTVWERNYSDIPTNPGLTKWVEAKIGENANNWKIDRKSSYIDSNI